MKKIILATAAALTLSANAMAFPSGAMDFPDFEMIRNYEKSAIAKDANVIAYARKLRASSFRVTNGKPGILNYGVVTSNNCSFDVEVVYNDWPGIDAIVITSKAVCR